MLVLDTHIWHWWTNRISKQLSIALIEQIETADIVGVSAVSLYEMASLMDKGRIDVGLTFKEWLEHIVLPSDVQFLDVTPTIAKMAAALPSHHRDPMDRIIMATALVHQAQLVSADEKFALYDELKPFLLRA